MGGIVNKITGADKAAKAARRGAQASAQAITESTDKNIEFQKFLWGEQKEITQPFVDAGKGQIDNYLDQANTPFDFQKDDPGYQFSLNEGAKAYGNSGAAKGMMLSGRQAKDLTRFGTDYASTKYQEGFNRRQTGLDNLYRMITMGSNAATGQVTAGTQSGAQISNSIGQAGQAQAQMHSDIGNINASSAMSGFNTLMDAGNLYAKFKGG